MGMCRFGFISATSIAIGTITFPIEHIVLTDKLHNMDANTSLFLYLAEIERFCLSFDNFKNELCHQPPGAGLLSLVKIVGP